MRGAVLAEHRDFRRLFAGISVSLLGSSVTTVAMPLTAVVYLHASAIQMGLLGAMSLLPHLVLGLPAGVWVDQLPYRRVLVLADLIQAAALACVPLLAVADLLRMWQLYVVVAVAGTGNLFATVAAQSFTPMLVPRRSLLAANGALMVSNAAVTTAGTATGGLLVALLSAPVAIAVDAVSFLVAAATKAAIRRPGAAATPRPSRLRADIADGVRAVFSQPIVRALIMAAAVGSFAGAAQAVVVVLYFVRNLRLSPGLVGLAITVSGLAGVVAAVLATRLSARIGLGRAHIMGMFLASAAGLVLASATAWPMWPALVVAQIMRGAGPSIYGVNQQTLRQALIGPHLIARANATWRFLTFGMQSLGALVGGVLGFWLGMAGTLVVSSCLMLVGTTIAIASPLRSLRTIGDPPDNGEWS